MILSYVPMDIVSKKQSRDSIENQKVVILHFLIKDMDEPNYVL